MLDLPVAWRNAFFDVYKALQTSTVKTLLTTYFGGLEDNLKLACQLPVSGLHLDGVRAPAQMSSALEWLDPERILSVGIVNGRNIWKTDLKESLKLLYPLQKKLKDRLWISGSCSFFAFSC